MWKRELGSVNDFIVDNRIYLLIRTIACWRCTEGGVTLWTQSDLLHRLLTRRCCITAAWLSVIAKAYALD
jgi:outer membrane protein assembly factor BamB